MPTRSEGLKCTLGDVLEGHSGLVMRAMRVCDTATSAGRRRSLVG